MATLLPVTTTAAAAADTVIDDFDDGDAGDWVFFGGNAAGGGGGAADDTPQAGTHYLSTGWGGEGTASGFYGGTFRNLADGTVAVPDGPTAVELWVLPRSSTTVDTFTLEMTVREDGAGDGWQDGTDESFRLQQTFTAFDDTWTRVTAPLAALEDLTPGGDGTLNGFIDEVVLVVVGVEGGSGSIAEFGVDSIALVPSTTSAMVDDFESGLPDGADGDGAPLGFYTFQGAGSSIGIATEATPPGPVRDGAADGNDVLRMDVDSTSFAGWIHAFENTAVDTWVTQDWSTREGIRFWFHGEGSGSKLFIDILDNRNPGSTTDDAERFTVAFTDDTAGWSLLEFPFTQFTRKEIGNGAPNDGLGLFAMHGYALGTLGTGGPRTFHVDDVEVYGEAAPPALAVNFSRSNNPITEGTTGQIGVELNRPMGPDDPAEVSIGYRTEDSLATPGEEFTPTSGTVTFTNGSANEQFFSIETFDDTVFEGDERIVIRLVDPSEGLERGALFQASAYVADDDPYDPDLLDDFESGAFLWNTSGDVAAEAVRVAGDDADARPGQDASEALLQVTAGGPQVGPEVAGLVADVEALAVGASRKDAFRLAKVVTRLEQAADAAGTKQFFDRLRQAVVELGKVDGAAAAALADDVVGLAAAVTDAAVQLAATNGEDVAPVAEASGPAAVTAARRGWVDATAAVAGRDELTLGAFGREFALGQDWTGTESVEFWYRGTGSGEDVTFTLLDDRAPDPGPEGWELVWADEFDAPAGTAPDAASWTAEVGDATPDGKNGWGNEELQYYTGGTENAAHDGEGNLVLTLREDDSGRECYYGPCGYTSSRLLTQEKAEFAYGRIESRLQVPAGQGLWPAFWSLGTDITYNPWPGAGEIDIMEFVGRLPDEIFGTVHGPGYSGGGSISNIYTFDEPVPAEFHTFTVEWEPELITWYVDGIQYHQVTPADVPGPWVFEKPFFLLLNLAIGGNFGGPVGDDVAYPAEYLVDYVRVEQAPDTAERFATTFVDDTDGWQLVTVPVADLVRSAEQPAGAPDNGLTLTDVWGYGLTLPAGADGTTLLDSVRRVPVPPPTEVVVTTATDAGDGSLRAALAAVAPGGTVSFDPALTGETITLTTGQLVARRDVSVDGSGAPGLVISGDDASRVLQVDAGATVDVSDLTVADGAASPRGGGILNLGDLTLTRVTVRDNTVTGTNAFDHGGGGIWTGESAALTLVDSTVRDNAAPNQPGGGLYGFFGSTTLVQDSTVTGNTAGDVAGGIRSLGNLTVRGSTISDNLGTAWHGSGLFLTDGTVVIEGSTIVGNGQDVGTAGGLMVATFGAPVGVTVQDSYVGGNPSYSCQVEGNPASAVLTSLGGNTFTDESCNPVASDTVDPAATP